MASLEPPGLPSLSCLWMDPALQHGHHHRGRPPSPLHRSPGLLTEKPPAQVSTLETEEERYPPRRCAFQPEYQRVNNYSSFQGLERHINFACSIGQGEENTTYLKFKRNITLTKKPLSLFHVLSAYNTASLNSSEMQMNCLIYSFPGN